MADYLIKKLIEASGLDYSQEKEDEMCSDYKGYDDEDNYRLDDLQLYALRNESYAYHMIREANKKTARALRAYNDLCESSKYIVYSTSEEKREGRERFLRLREEIIKEVRTRDYVVLRSLILIRKLYTNIRGVYLDVVELVEHAENTNLQVQFYNDVDNELLGETYFEDMFPKYSDDEYLYRRKEIEATFLWIAENVYKRDVKEIQKDSRAEALQKLRNFYIINDFSLNSTCFPSTNEVLVSTEIADVLCLLFEGSSAVPSPYEDKVILKLGKPLYEVNKTLQNLLLDKNLAL